MTTNFLSRSSLSSRAAAGRRGTSQASSGVASESARRRLFGRSLLLFLFITSSLHAQNILLKSGQTIETKGVRRSGDMVMGKVQVGASSGEVGYQASTIAKIDFPQPPQLKTTEAFLGQEDWKNALAEIRPVVKYYEAFRDLPGNWWAQAALLEVSALGGMQLDKEAETLGDEIRKNSTDPETARAAQLQLVPRPGAERTILKKRCSFAMPRSRKARSPRSSPKPGCARATLFSRKDSGTAPSSLICTCRSSSRPKNVGCRLPSLAVPAPSAV